MVLRSAPFSCPLAEGGWGEQGGGTPALLLCTKLPFLQDPALYLSER